MRKLIVLADFDWLGKEEVIGELGFDDDRTSYSFEFDGKWLKEHGDIFLCSDLHCYMGPQFTKPGEGMFACLSDVLPEIWGRLLLDRREEIQARKERRPARKPTSLDYLTWIDDFTRMGGFRLKDGRDGGYINAHERLHIPPLARTRQLWTASRMVEESEENRTLPKMEWIAQLVAPGSSLGGARPKANVVDVDGSLHMAKFPSIKDGHDVGLWEHFAHLLAGRAGINAARTRAIPVGGKRHALLSRRFDRTTSGRRIHFASAMSLLGLRDGDGAATGHGYLDIVDFMLRNCVDVRENIRELYRRVAFSICIGNTDDHFRNHGFLLTGRGWTLAPAYDINPTNGKFQAILITSSADIADLGVLLEASSEYMLSRSEAEGIVSGVRQAVMSWRDLALGLGIPRREMEMFAPTLDRRAKT